MTKPSPDPVPPGRLVETALETMRAARFPMLATIDGEQPRLRPVSPVRTEHFTVWIANLRRYGKTAEIAANPRVELCYLSPDHDQVRITGEAVVEDSRALLDTIWEENPLLRRYLGTPDNPELIVYRVEPHRVRFMREWALAYDEVPADRSGRPRGGD